MAYTFRNKRLAYDNIAAGEATGVERHIAGGGGIETTRQSIDELTHTANAPSETPLGVYSSDSGNPINVPGSTSADTLGHTSTTSWTSAFHENL